MTKDERFENFKKRSRELHPEGNIDLSEFVYVNNRTPSWVIDHSLRPDGTEYGRFLQTPSNHLKGQEHPDKRSEKISRSKRDSWDEILRKCKAAHPGENLEYPVQEVRNFHEKIRIIDHDLRPDGEEYGEYWQEVNSHIRGSGHPQKAIDRNSDKQRYTTEKFIELSREVHSSDDISYDECVYVDHRKKVKLFCNKIGSNGKPHGVFWATPDNFLQGKGCPKCGNHLSYGEEDIVSFLEGNGVKCERYNRSVLNGYELDIYCPDFGIAIEFNGLKWHTEKYHKGKFYHLEKTLGCEAKNVKLIHVFEDEWLENRELVLSKISRIFSLSKTKTIGARKCVVEKCTKEEAKSFLEKNHIQGFASSTVYYGAYLVEDNRMVGVMSFKKTKDEWELTRFATDISGSFPGLASKMLKVFLEEYKPETVKSFADRRWTLDKNENLYIKMGFVLEDVLPPDYRYVCGNKRKHKFGFRKKILSKKYNLPLEWTEKQMCDELGFYRIWDCGLFKYVWKNNDKTNR